VASSWSTIQYNWSVLTWSIIRKNRPQRRI
jgi:hypothetical protein